MPEENNNKAEEEIIGWEIPEFRVPKRGRSWYITASLVAVILIIYALLTTNFLFALFVVLAAIVMIMNHGQQPGRVKVSFTNEGVYLDNKFYDYDEFENFSILYKPKQGIKNLYMEFNNPVKQRLSIPLEGTDPADVHELLSDFLDEDTDRTEPPLSERLADLFKL